MTNCVICGAEVGDARYCTRCGAQTGRFPVIGTPPPPPPPPPGAWPVPPRGPGRRRRITLLAMGVAVLLVAAGVGGYLWLRPAGETTASVTDPALPISEASTGAAEPTGDRSADTTRSPASGGSAPGGPTSVRSTPTSAGTTSFVPVPTGATADCSAPDSIDAAGVTQTYEPAKAFDGKRETAW